MLVKYNLAPRVLWHERLVLGTLPEKHWYVICTPDFDIYEERLTLNSNDLAGLSVVGSFGEVPFGCHDRDQFYRFAPVPDGTEWPNWVQQANGLINGWVNQGGPATAVVLSVDPRQAPTAPAAPAVVNPMALAADERWMVAAVTPGLAVGEVVTGVPNDGHLVGKQALVEVGGQPLLLEKVKDTKVSDRKEELLQAMAIEVADLRVMPVKFQGGKRLRVFGEAVDLLEEDTSLDGFPEGPRTVATDMQELRSQALTPQTFTAFWVRTNEIPKGDRSVYEMQTLGEILHAMICIDQLNAANLVSAAVICRRRSAIIEAHRLSPSNPDYSAAEVMMGLGARQGGGQVSTSLASWTAGKLRDQAQIDKEKRKAQEEAALRGKKK